MYLSEEIGMIPNMDMETERGTYPRVEAEIDLGAIRDNFAAMRGRLRDDTKMIAVVKTDAYGHGAVRIAEMMEPEAYIWGFAVATTEEAVELRRAVPSGLRSAGTASDPAGNLQAVHGKTALGGGFKGRHDPPGPSGSGYGDGSDRISGLRRRC